MNKRMKTRFNYLIKYRNKCIFSNWNNICLFNLNVLNLMKDTFKDMKYINMTRGIFVPRHINKKGQILKEIVKFRHVEHF